MNNRGCRGGTGAIRQSYHPYGPLVNVYIAMERSTIFDGSTRYFNGHVQWQTVSHYQTGWLFGTYLIFSFSWECYHPN